MEDRGADDAGDRRAVSVLVGSWPFHTMSVHSTIIKVTDMVEQADQLAELDNLQSRYKAAIEEWIAAIRKEEALASVNHTVAEVDKWEQAHFDEEEARATALVAKEAYEEALRRKFFGF
jgi:hypothetical protein